jgi:hypothetical protein
MQAEGGALRQAGRQDAYPRMAFASTNATFTDFISTMLFKTAITSRISGEQRRLPLPAEGTKTVGQYKARVHLLQYLLKKTDK